jgi:hypothetical protein
LRCCFSSHLDCWFLINCCTVGTLTYKDKKYLVSCFYIFSSVKHKICKNKKTAIAIPDEDLQTEGNKIIDKQTVRSYNGTLLIEKEENSSQRKNEKKKKKKKWVLSELVSTKRKHKEVEGPEDSKVTLLLFELLYYALTDL